MRTITKILTTLITIIHMFSHSHPLIAENQTAALTPVLPPDSLPFTIEIKMGPFALPTGLQSFVDGVYDGLWVLLAGRTNGLHGFDDFGNNFPPSYQNTTVYVIDPKNGVAWSRRLDDTTSGLSQLEIDDLSVTAPQFFQKDKMLYVVGGYGINTLTNQMETKNRLTAIDLKKMIRWVQEGKPSLKKAIQQVSDPILRVTGGALFQDNDHDPFLLIMGQDFEGLYLPGNEGIYTEQVRAFWLKESKEGLSILPKRTLKRIADYRRRDLNVVPIIHDNRTAYVALSGVFTLTGGAWTVPVTVFPDGSSFEPDAHLPGTFKQAMNQYHSPTIGLYSTHNKNMYIVLPGGISLGFFSGGQFQIDQELPFINQVTTIKIDKKNRYSQHIMDGEYPYIVSTGSNPGNQLLFGAEAHFFRAPNLPLFRNDVIRLDDLPKKPTILGYIAGGIMSTLPNTNTRSDSTASPYVFTVTLVPK